MWHTTSMNNAITLATKNFENIFFGGRTIKAYQRPGHARGEYAVRLFLPAGELLPYEVFYAYEGNDINAARAAWKATVKQWEALYAGVPAVAGGCQ